MLSLHISIPFQYSIFYFVIYSLNDTLSLAFLILHFIHFLNSVSTSQKFHLSYFLSTSHSTLLLESDNTNHSAL